MFPSYFASFIQWRWVWFNWSGAGINVKGFLLKIIPFVLLLAGSGGVLNAILCFPHISVQYPASLGDLFLMGRGRASQLRNQNILHSSYRWWSRYLYSWEDWKGCRYRNWRILGRSLPPVPDPMCRRPGWLLALLVSLYIVNNIIWKYKDLIIVLHPTRVCFSTGLWMTSCLSEVWGR